MKITYHNSFNKTNLKVQTNINKYTSKEMGRKAKFSLEKNVKS